MSLVGAALILCWIAVAVLALGVAGLIRQVQELQRALGGAIGLAPSQLIAQRLSGSQLAHELRQGDRASLKVMLIVAMNSSASAIVVQEFVTLAANNRGVEFHIASSAPLDGVTLKSLEDTPIRVVVDGQLVASARIPFSPALVVMDSKQVRMVEPVGSPAALRALLRDCTALQDERNIR
jgi:hypothetical protein